MTYQNGAPQHLANGVEDGSALSLPPVAKETKHCQPLVFLNTPKGGYEETEVTGAELIKIFGFEAINPLGKYFNHQSNFALDALGLGAQVSVRRAPYIRADGVLTGDGVANLTIYQVKTASTIATKTIDRDPLTGHGTKINGDWELTSDDIDATFYEYTVKYHTADELAAGLQTLTITDGCVRDGVTVDAVLTPIITIPAYGHGDFYNNIGVKLYPLIEGATDNDMVNSSKFPYYLSLVDKSTGAEQILKTIDSDDGVKFSFHPNASHPTVGNSITLEDLVPSKFGNVTNPQFPLMAFDIGTPIFHRGNIDAVSTSTLTDELTVVTSVEPYMDIVEPTPAEALANIDEIKYLSNILTTLWSAGAPYETIRDSELLSLSVAARAAAGNKVIMSETTPFYMAGGLDGNISDVDQYEESMLRVLGEYADQDSVSTHLALSRISEFVDTGFTLDTKLQLGIFTSYRTDVRLIGATYAVNELNEDITISEHLSRSALLTSIYRMSIESAKYNTASFRTAVVIGSGLDKKGLYRYRLPLSYDFALKNVKMFKGTKWNSVYEFSTQPNNVVHSLVDVSPRMMPRTLKTKAWGLGVIWPDASDKQNVYYPQMQTIYTDDTSVLNGWYSAVATCFLEKMLDEAHRERSGDQISTSTEQVDKMNVTINDKVTDQFANIIIPAVDVFKTPRDMAAGYAVTANVKMYAPNMFTVLTSGILALRKV